MRNKIGESLLRAGLVRPDALKAALSEQKRSGERLGAVLVRMNLATEEQIAEALAAQLGFPYVSLSDAPPDPAAARLIPKAIALKGVCAAIRLEGDVLTVAMADPLVFSLVQDIEVRTGCRVRQVLSTPAEIFTAIESGYSDVPEFPATSGADAESSDQVHEVEGERDSPVLSEADIVDLVVKSAARHKGSAVHVDLLGTRAQVRQRLDGVLQDVMTFEAGSHAGVVARLKSLAGMDASETRLPQEGRLRVRADDGADVDLRVSTLRTTLGERAVIGALDRGRAVPTLSELGLSPAALEQTRACLAGRQGMFIVVGPAGSGRSTTLAAVVGLMRAERDDIVTIEDPVAHPIADVIQTNVDEQVGVTFAIALRSAMSQDADVIVVGDLRDSEVVGMALQAAESGLLVAALRADDSSAGVRRLMELGGESTAIADVLVGVIAQRLVRRLCVRCRRRYMPSEETLGALNMSEADGLVFYEAIGCDQCSHTGYRGRIGVFEVMRVTDPVRRLIAAGADGDRIRHAALAGGLIALGEDGLAKVKAGLTTAEELFRVVPDPGETRPLCVACGTAVAADFKACPACGARLGACPHCGRAVQTGWNFCPYCSRSTTGGRPSRRRDGRGPRKRPDNVAAFRK